MIIDKLYGEVEKKGNVCVGLDTNLDYVPNHIKEKYQDIDQILFQFNKKIIDCTIDLVPVYKLQIAFYEAYGIKGLVAYKRTLEYIKSLDSISIGDIKRGDIASTAEMYAKAHFEGEFETDFITLNPYMGFDSITPYLKYLEAGNKGIFVLLRTSNPGAKDIQYLNVKGQRRKDNGQWHCNSQSYCHSQHSKGAPLYYYVGDRLAEIGEKYMGNCGFSAIGAVVGGTHINEAIEIRDRYKNMFFLIPGYGHQGGKGKDVTLYLNKGNGGIVNSSRGIILAYKDKNNGKNRFGYYARQAVLSMKEDIENEIRL
ncbi:MAG: orotidine-5'-phosphate decarboxylase [Tissierellia bacterium]|nr:orotidine-5'-phosphate decarboxylase [Tissierellia bacterium]